MPYDNYQSVPFWDFIRSMDAADRTGAGVDQPASGFQQPPPPPFGPHGFGFGGFGGPHFFASRGFGGPGRCGRSRGPPGCDFYRGDESQDQCPPYEHGEPKGPGESKEAEVPVDSNEPPRNENAEGHRCGPCHGGSRHWGRRHGPHGPHGPWGRRRGPAGAPFDMSPLFQAFASHPIAQVLRTYVEQAANGEVGETDDENSFIPPIDVFSTQAAYILHVALPGAKKEDVGVNWDAEKSELSIAGVVYRQGDEEFLKTLSKKERRVGVFDRNVKLPPGEEEKEEVDGDNITAKLEDGVLIVTVPKVEKEWTEVKKVDIE